MSSAIVSWHKATIAPPCARERSPSTTRIAALDATDEAGEPFFLSSIHESSRPTVVYMFWRAPRP